MTNAYKKRAGARRDDFDLAQAANVVELSRPP